MNGANNKGVIQTLLISVATAAIVFVATSAYYINNMSVGNTSLAYEYDGSFTKLKNVLNLVKKDFLFDDYDMEELEDGAIRGMLEALDDPYTSYFDASETESFLIETEGEYEGVGMYITYGSDIEWPMVLSVIKNSPAEEAGVEAGDYIYEVDGEKMTKETSLEEVAHRLKGKAESTVDITFIRVDEDGNQKEIEKELVRRKVEISSFDYEVKDGNIGYMRFESFDEDADVQFKKAYNDLVDNKKVKGIIIDIRDNPGGLLNTVVNIADMLVPNGIITYTVDKNGNKDTEYSDSKCSSVPIVVLVNENSASASEILAAAVKDHGVGKIVGKTTYGKGLVQKFVGLGDGTYVKLTIAEYFSPNGTKINKIGVVPDYEVEKGEDAKVDAQLEKALEVIKGM